MVRSSTGIINSKQSESYLDVLPVLMRRNAKKLQQRREDKHLEFDGFDGFDGLDLLGKGVVLILAKPGLKIREVCLIRVAEAKKLSYFLTNFLISFLFLLNFFKSSTVISARLQCFTIRTFERWNTGSRNKFPFQTQ
jgi:hypothetical protein